jgi:dGTPase
LKAIVAKNVMSHSARQPAYVSQRNMLGDLLNALFDAPENLDAVFAHDWAGARTLPQKKRVILDQVASLTDQSAGVWHERLCQ